MSPRPERRWPKLLAGSVFFLGLVSLATVPIYLSVAASSRPTVIRLAAALVVALVLIRLRQAARARIADEASSPFERALQPIPVRRTFDPLYLRLQDEVRFSVAGQGYFESVLWLRLLALAAGQRPGTPLVKPSGRWPLRRGPSLRALGDVITTLERGA